MFRPLLPIPRMYSAPSCIRGRSRARQPPLYVCSSWPHGRQQETGNGSYVRSPCLTVALLECTLRKTAWGCIRGASRSTCTCRFGVNVRQANSNKGNTKVHLPWSPPEWRRWARTFTTDLHSLVNLTLPQRSIPTTPFSPTTSTSAPQLSSRSHKSLHSAMYPFASVLKVQLLH